MKWLAIALLVAALLMLQYRLWLSDSGVREVIAAARGGQRSNAHRTARLWSATGSWPRKCAI